MAVRKALRLPAVIEATGLAKPTIYKQIADGKFPKGTKLGPRVRIWFEDEIENYQKGEWRAPETEAA